MSQEREAHFELPVLPLRDVVVYPHMVIPLFVGREKSIRCLETAMAQDKQIMLVAQRDADLDEPAADDIFEVGTIASILQLLKLPDGTVKVLVEGGRRARVARFTQEEPFFVARIEELPSDPTGREGRRGAGTQRHRPV